MLRLYISEKFNKFFVLLNENGSVTSVNVADEFYVLFSVSWYRGNCDSCTFPVLVSVAFGMRLEPSLNIQCF